MKNTDRSEQPLCFVIMPFSPVFDEYYHEIIKPSIIEAGMRPQRADEVLKPGAFMRDVVNGIDAAKCLVADITGHNPNVFYELGLAHGFCKPVIMITQHKSDVPSDLKSLKWLLYEPILVHWADTLRRRLVDTLKEVLVDEDQQLIAPFIHPKNAKYPLTNGLSFGELTGTQKQFLDYIHQKGGWVFQRDVERRFSNFPSAEVFYRLEHLRLLGFLNREEVDPDVSGKPLYDYLVSPDAQALYSE